MAFAPGIRKWANEGDDTVSQELISGISVGVDFLKSAKLLDQTVSALATTSARTSPRTLNIRLKTNIAFLPDFQPIVVANAHWRDTDKPWTVEIGFGLSGDIGPALVALAALKHPYVSFALNDAERVSLAAQVLRPLNPRPTEGARISDGSEVGAEHMIWLPVYPRRILASPQVTIEVSFPNRIYPPLLEDWNSD
jgi:hypothetical protein